MADNIQVGDLIALYEDPSHAIGIYEVTSLEDQNGLYANLAALYVKRGGIPARRYRASRCYLVTPEYFVEFIQGE